MIQLDTQFKVLADMLPDNVAMHDSSTRILHYNKVLLGTLGKTLDEVVGKTPEEIFPDGRYLAYEANLRRVVETGEEVSFDITAKTPRGVEHHNIRMVPQHDSNGRLISIIAVGRDYTERVRFEQKLVQSSKLSALGEMAAGVAHEINNPLAIISGKCELLELLARRDKLEKSDLLKEISEILDTGSRIGRIIRGLRTFARDGQQDPLVMVSLRTVLDDTLSVIGQRLKHSNVELRYRPEDFNALAAYGSLTGLAQVLLSLVSNAFDAVAGQPGAWIRLEARDLGEAVEVSVTDSGPGIPAELRGRIMQPFFSTKDSKKGMGLGLSVASGIVREHHGRLELDESSANTRFVLTLPKAKSIGICGQGN